MLHAQLQTQAATFLIRRAGRLVGLTRGRAGRRIAPGMRTVRVCRRRLDRNRARCPSCADIHPSHMCRCHRGRHAVQQQRHAEQDMKEGVFHARRRYWARTEVESYSKLPGTWAANCRGVHPGTRTRRSEHSGEKRKGDQESGHEAGLLRGQETQESSETRSGRNCVFNGRSHAWPSMQRSARNLRTPLTLRNAVQRRSRSAACAGGCRPTSYQ